MNNKAFSLIELSIVLIIIGLLVAGITGGASLVESAKRTALINEIDNYRKGTFAFYSLHNRLPGDTEKLGKIGAGSGYVYTSSSFPTPYDGTDSDHSIPNSYMGVFVDLYLDKIIDFEPKKSGSNAFYTAENGGAPLLKSIPDYFIFNVYYDKSNTGSNLNSQIYNSRGNYFRVENYSLYSDAESKRRLLSAKFVEKVDNKIDDGIHNTGKVTGGCYGTEGSRGANSYSNAVQNKRGCDGINFYLGL